MYGMVWHLFMSGIAREDPVCPSSSQNANVNSNAKRRMVGRPFDQINKREALFWGCGEGQNVKKWTHELRQRGDTVPTLNMGRRRPCPIVLSIVYYFCEIWLFCSSHLTVIPVFFSCRRLIASCKRLWCGGGCCIIIINDRCDLLALNDTV